jgi:hypothetical protein
VVYGRRTESGYELRLDRAGEDWNRLSFPQLFSIVNTDKFLQSLLQNGALEGRRILTTSERREYIIRGAYVIYHVLPVHLIITPASHQSDEPIQPLPELDEIFLYIINQT